MFRDTTEKDLPILELEKAIEQFTEEDWNRLKQLGQLQEEMADKLQILKEYMARRRLHEFHVHGVKLNCTKSYTFKKMVIPDYKKPDIISPEDLKTKYNLPDSLFCLTYRIRPNDFAENYPHIIKDHPELVEEINVAKDLKIGS